MRRWTTELQLGILKESHEKYLVAKATICLYDESKKVARALVAHMEQLKAKLEEFQSFVEDLQVDLHKQSDQFPQFSAKVLFIQVFDRERNWKEFYRLGINDMNEPQEVQPSKEFAAFLRQSINPKATILDLVDSFQGKTALEKKLTDYCETRFRQDFNSSPRKVNLLESSLFKDEFTSKQTISKLVRNAMPMMRILPDLAGQALNTSRQAYLGICDIDDSKWRDFADKVQAQLSTLGYTNVNRQSTGNSSEVYLNLVNYAFPLSALNIVVNECHSAYSNFYKKLRKDRRFQIPLHLSRHWDGKFPELIVYTEEKAIQVKEAREILLFGTLMKVLTIKDKKQLEFGYIDGHPLNRTTWLGPKWEAIDTLCTDLKTRRMLQQAISDRKRDLTAEQLAALYWAIQYLRSASQSDIDEPEQVLLEQEVKDLNGLLTTKKLLTEEMRMEGVPDNGRAGFCKAVAPDTLDWSGEIPVLKNIEQWTKAFNSNSDELNK